LGSLARENGRLQRGKATIHVKTTSAFRRKVRKISVRHDHCKPAGTQ
jgi:hypothetical protein